MALLLNHPEVLEKARTELENQVGNDQLIEEEDLSKLPYLQFLILETFRLFPVAPLLVWDKPIGFKPKRFEGVEVESSKLMPFGMGRRLCPSSSLAQRRISEEEVDLAENDGLTMPKAQPLVAKCKARNIIHKVFLETAKAIIFM
ncbi:hypothetical protein M9H77_05724 [Catharanthus roseus]|uniref:Uncharacterized protein n=1 Tax=Catharanthus roseus TaxID=4058 RepID=A0ACC0CHY0_CATRO|nr:hypothetical protein M9H77_05724 [Catharanthus roseus]